MEEEQEGFDLRFKNPCSFLLVGSSQCGKTSLVFQCLRNAKTLFRDPRCAQNVLYFFNVWQRKFDEFDREGIITEWIQELPTKQLIEEKTAKYVNHGGSIIIIDDYCSKLKSSDIFTILTHHCNCVTFLLSQNLFSNNPAYRDISLNCTYNIIFKSTRDFKQFRTFARQIFPSDSSFLIDVYENETKKQYSYLLIDHDHSTNPSVQIRSNFIPGNGPMRIFRKKK